MVRINLGPEQPVSEAIDTWRVTFGMSPPAAAAGKLLRQNLWEPIEAQLGGAKIVLVSPDGAVSRLPLGALPGKEPGSYPLGRADAGHRPRGADDPRDRSARKAARS